jgi:hypothetical protein
MKAGRKGDTNGGESIVVSPRSRAVTVALLPAAHSTDVTSEVEYQRCVLSLSLSAGFTHRCTVCDG